MSGTSWQWCALGDLALTIDYGHTSSAVDTPEGPRFLRITDIQDGRVDWLSVPGCTLDPGDAEKYQLISGDLVFARTGATTGKSFLIENPPTAVFASYLIRLRLAPELYPKFVAYYFQSTDYWRQISSKKTGSAQPGVNATILKSVDVPIAPDGEQRRVVNILDSYITRLDSAVAGLKRVQANLKRYRASVLKAAVEGRLVPTEAELARAEGRTYEPASELLARILKERRARWEANELASMKAKGKPPKDDKWKSQYKDPAPPNTKDLPKLPEGWCWATVDQLAAEERYSLAIGPFGSNLKVSDYCDQGVPLVFVRHIRAENFDGREPRFVSLEKALELSAHQVNGGDVVITKMGEPPGEATVYPPDRPTGVITADCIKMTPHAFLSGAAYLVTAIRSPYVQSQIGEITKGVAQKKVSLARFKKVCLPVAPHAEQKRVDAEVEKQYSLVDASIEIVERSLKRAARLRQSILKWAFEGKLVDQDPNDEPASVLLARIRAEQEETAPAKKRPASTGAKQSRDPPTAGTAQSTPKRGLAKAKNAPPPEFDEHWEVSAE